MSETSPQVDPIRRKIEALSSQLSLPTVRKALGILEGEHPSGQRGNGYDYAGIRAYEPGDESRLIDWSASARTGQPMVAEKERQVNSRVWMLMDVGYQMKTSTPSGESAANVAANALRMFAALSLRRSDELSVILADSKTIRRVPAKGGLAQFEQTLDSALTRPWQQPRNIDALLKYALDIRDRHALLVIASDETALADQQIASIRKLARTHPVVVISVATINPFSSSRGPNKLIDGYSGRELPQFMTTHRAARSLDVHRKYQHAALEHELTRFGSRVIHAGSSEAMFHQFVDLLSLSLNTPTGLGGQSLVGPQSSLQSWSQPLGRSEL